MAEADHAFSDVLDPGPMPVGTPMVDAIAHAIEEAEREIAVRGHDRNKSAHTQAPALISWKSSLSRWRFWLDAANPCASVPLHVAAPDAGTRARNYRAHASARPVP